MQRVLVTTIFLAVLAEGSKCFAERLNFQGQLHDANGNTWAGASVNLVFRVYDESGTLIQGPIAVATVPVAGGFVNTNFDVSLSTLDTVSKRLLGVAVDGGSEMQPRIELMRVPYAVS